MYKFPKLPLNKFYQKIELLIKQGYNRNISKLMNFIFGNRTIFWDISKWNRGQTKWDEGFCQKKKSGTEVAFIINNLLF